MAAVTVTYKDKKHRLQLLVAQGTGPSLLGRDWFEPLGISVICKLQVASPVSLGDSVKAEIPDVFQPGLGTFTGPAVSLTLLPNAIPKFMRYRPVAFALQAKVVEEIDRLVGEGVWEPVSDSKWATPIVPVLKRDGTIRLCADYRATVNPAVATDVYPLLTLDEALAALSGGKYFTKLDLRNAYTQVPVDEAASEVLTVNTPCGLFRVKRLPFDLKAAPGIFQRLMMSLMKGLKGVIVLLDDILVIGASEAEHDCRVRSVLLRLKNAGLRLKGEKCVFAALELQFLGHTVSARGIRPTDEKVQAIKNVPVPKNKTELQAFLGLLNFYDRFLPNRAHVLEPLYRLLKQNLRWSWNKAADTAFHKAKELLSSSSCLTLYDGNRPLVVTCDASSVGVGAVMSHVNDDGGEHLSSPDWSVTIG
uniref:Reverse transcriptase domain-containing protein n=1 Tax=Trichuris muris TaxID=70415 RepID=A0A5S6Q6F4_TRIMR